ncbi:hypothetical protein CARUB_v10024912mg [Capsella rubella]|uniref:KIB1-4 beta-propeller domain-containing protein n=1 Tax=Capsella rubella TaxID=81985 RepID=R0G0J6_9BRAS|nr:hypothetical protein CARUB_v10024912mg [Capsella rubella]
MAAPETKKKISTSLIMPDWSQLPDELLPLISTHLEECFFDVIHARSVCSLWRSAFPYPTSIIRQSYSLPTVRSESNNFCTLEKVPLFLFRVRAPHYDVGGKRRRIVVLRTYSMCTPLLVLTSAEMRWKPLEFDNTSDGLCVGIFACRGKFYATFLPGRVLVIDPYSLEVTLLLPSPHPVHSLVPFGNDELFLVDVSFHSVAGPGIRQITCRVSRLDEMTGTWVGVKDLGNRVLFIGGLGNFSCSGKELPHGCGLHGNSILFTNLPGNVTSAFEYGVHTGDVEEDLNCWRSSRVNRVMILEKSSPMVAFQVEC